jgi:hypothetical protein
MIFISYSSCDRKVAEELCNYLENKGLGCWVAFRDVTSGNFAGEITRALRTSDIFLLIASKESCKSEHVKNEVTLAFNQKKHFVPYLLEDNPYDDDLEYFLSLKQHIKTRGSQEKDFALIEKFIRDYRAVYPEPESSRKAIPVSAPAPSPAPAASAPAGKKSPLPIVLAVVGVLAACGVAFFLLNKPAEQQAKVDEPKVEAPAVEQPKEEPKADVTVQPKAQEQPKAQAQPKVQDEPKAQPKKTTGGNTFSGSVVKGYPDGFGTYRFTARRRIDMHDPEERYAEAGDYIKGDWRQGHLNYGEWYDKDGNKKAFIKLGDNPDVEADQKLGTCVKQ